MTELLNNLDSQSGFESVFNKTRLSIARSSEGEQVPTVSSSLQEDVSLASAVKAGS